MITEAESRALWQVLEPYFKEIGWQVEPLNPTRWYLGLDEDPGLQTRSMHSAWGGPVGDVLPPNRIAASWAARLTELQMLLHDASVNRQREQLGKPTINSFWLWGGGKTAEGGSGRGRHGVLDGQRGCGTGGIDR